MQLLLLVVTFVRFVRRGRMRECIDCRRALNVVEFVFVVLAAVRRRLLIRF
jgi:hypothetical protein